MEWVILSGIFMIVTGVTFGSYLLFLGRKSAYRQRLEALQDDDNPFASPEETLVLGNLTEAFAGQSPLTEGKTKAIRQELREAGFYDTTLRRAGEDQVLSARMRAAGHRVCRAPTLRYYLSVSSDQDSLLKLVRHAQLFGRVTPYLLLANLTFCAAYISELLAARLDRRLQWQRWRSVSYYTALVITVALSCRFFVNVSNDFF